jgi:aryl-alcohol dehydrogenase-like predicted oxidoreductase
LIGKIQKFEDLAEDDYRRYSPRFQGENFQKNLDLVKRIKEMAAEKGCQPSHLALAWLLAQGDDIVPIPGTKRIPYLEENLKALDISLTEDELAQINEIAPLGIGAGERYPESALKNVNL